MWLSFLHPTVAILSTNASLGLPQNLLWRGGYGERKCIKFWFVRDSRLLSLPCPSNPRLSQETQHLVHMADLRGKVIMQNRQLEQILLWLKMATIRQKTDFCLQETLSSLQPKQHKIQGKHFIIFPPLFGNMEKKILPWFFFPSFYQKSHFFFPSPELTNDWVWFFWCLEQRTDSAKKRAWMGDSLQEIVKLLRKHRPSQQAVFTTLAYLNTMKILSALLITSSLNRTELFITNATSDHKYTKQKHATLIS